MIMYMISIIERIQQRILHHEELKNLKIVDDSNAAEEFERFMSAFVNARNVADRLILNPLTTDDNDSNDLVEVNEDEYERTYSKENDDAEMMEETNEENENEKKKDEKNEKKDEEKEENHEIIKISN